MGARVKAFRVLAPDTVEAVVTQPEIWETGAADGQRPEEFRADTLGHLWLAVEDEGALMGLYCFRPVNSITLDGHGYVLPRHRGKRGAQSLRAAVRWLEENVEGWEKITAQVPVIYPNVKRFATDAGFRVEGCNRLSYKKNGAIIDQWVLGATRNELRHNRGG